MHSAQKLIVILSFFLRTLHAQNPVEMKEGLVDTVRFTGTCLFMGQTGSIIATSYYMFKVDKVLVGDFVGDTIVFEADINSKNEKFISSYIVGEPINVSADSLFPDHSMPIQKCYHCKGEPVQIEVGKYIEDRWWKSDVRVYYLKL